MQAAMSRSLAGLKAPTAGRVSCIIPITDPQNCADRCLLIDFSKKLGGAIVLVRAPFLRK